MLLIMMLIMMLISMMLISMMLISVMMISMMLLALLGSLPQDPADTKTETDLSAIRSATEFAGMSFTDEELAQLLPWATNNISAFGALREVPLNHGIAPATIFMPAQ